MDLATAQANYAAAQAAYLKALKAKSAGNLDYRVEHHDLKDLRAEMDYWARQVKDLQSSSTRPYAVARWTR